MTPIKATRTPRQPFKNQATIQPLQAQRPGQKQPVKPPKQPKTSEEGRQEKAAKKFLEQVGKAAGQLGFVGLATILGAPYAVAIWIKVYVLGIGHVPGPSRDERILREVGRS